MARGRIVFASIFVMSCASAGWAQEKLVAEGDEIKYFKGTEEPSVDWSKSGFDDSAWLDGMTPIGYSTDLAYKTVLSDMQNSYLTVYTRKKFNIANAAAVKALKFSMKYDDGFIAYVNGVEILRKSMNDGPATKDTAGLDHETNAAFEANLLTCATLASANLQTGDNVFAVEIHNVALSSSDLSLSFEVEAVSEVCPSELNCTPRATGQIVIRWSKPAGFNYDELSLYRNDVKLEPGPVKTSTSFTDRTPVQGVNNYRLAVVACGVECAGAGGATCSVTVGGGEPGFRRGDLDGNGSIGINDAVLVLNSLFRDGGPLSCPDAADADDNGETQLTDAVFILRFLFQGGGSPPPPLDTCGPDPTADALAQCVFPSCP